MNLETSIERVVYSLDDSDYDQVYAFLDEDKNIVEGVSIDWCLRGLKEPRSKARRGPLLAAKAGKYISFLKDTFYWEGLNNWLLYRSVYSKYYVKSFGTLEERSGVGLYDTTVGSAEGCIEAAMLERTLHQYPQTAVIWSELVARGVEGHKALCCAGSYRQSMQTILRSGWMAAVFTGAPIDHFPIPFFKSKNFDKEVENWLEKRGGNSYENSLFNTGHYRPVDMSFSKGPAWGEGGGEYDHDFDTRPVPTTMDITKCVELLA